MSMLKDSSRPCPLCGEEDTDRFKIWFDGYIKIFRCGTCSFVSQFPGPGSTNLLTCYEDAYNLDFLNAGQEFHYPTRQGPFEDIVRRILALQPHGKLLDVGCADGHFISVCKKAGYDCHGIDESMALTEYAAQRIGCEIKQGFYAKDSYPESSFDIVSMLQLVEHVAAPREILEAAHYHLKPGGLLVLECPSIQSPHFLAYRASRIKWFVKPPTGVIQCHCGYYDPKTMRMLTDKCGFQMVSLVTGRWKCKYEGVLRMLGSILDPLFNATNIGGILYLGRKVG